MFKKVRNKIKISKMNVQKNFKETFLSNLEKIAFDPMQPRFWDGSELDF